MTIPIIIVDRHFADASALFNPNAFSQMVRNDASMCADRLAILTHSVEIVISEPGLDRSRLLKEIRRNKAFNDFVPQPDKPAVLVLHNLNFLSGLYSTLIALKSLLDLYSRLIAKLLVPSASVDGLNRGSYRGRNIPRGRFLMWIECSAPKSFQNREKLVSVFLGHIDSWVDEAISYRDGVVHDGSIPGINEARLPLIKALSQLRETDVILPIMPGGVEVIDYCSRLVKSTRTLVAETLPLLPGVDVTLLALQNN